MSPKKKIVLFCNEKKIIFAQKNVGFVNTHVFFLYTSFSRLLMTFPPLISAASRWKIANLCLSAASGDYRSTQQWEPPDTVIKTFTRCHHSLVIFFFSSTMFFGLKLYANSSLTVRAWIFNLSCEIAGRTTTVHCPIGARIFHESGSS